MKEGLYKAFLYKLYRLLYRRRAGTVYEKKKASEREDSARRYTCHLMLLRSMFTSGNLLSY